jgi:hypothetical protein
MMMDTTRLQFLRTIDKHDRLGTGGVIDLLQKPMPEGPALDPVRAALVGEILDAQGGTNSETIQAMKSWFGRAQKITARLDFMVWLDDQSTYNEHGKTAWDRLIEMPTNADETWRDGGRPANIGWALDDLLAHITGEGQ